MTNNTQHSVIKISYSGDAHEYSLSLNGESDCYYTQDLQDAIDTAHSIGIRACGEYRFNNRGNANACFPTYAIK